MLDSELDKVAVGFEKFVECAMDSRFWEVYRHDIARLLELLYITLGRPVQDKWYEDRHDRLGAHCDYMIVKMSMDKRSEVNSSIPNWLYLLAGFYDQTPKRGERLQVIALLKIAPYVEPLMRRGCTKKPLREPSTLPAPGGDPSHEP